MKSQSYIVQKLWQRLMLTLNATWDDKFYTILQAEKDTCQWSFDSWAHACTHGERILLYTFNEHI